MNFPIEVGFGLNGRFDLIAASVQTTPKYLLEGSATRRVNVE